MKIVELLNNLQLTLNNEQADLLGRFSHERSIEKNKLSPREQEIANQLTMQNILLRQRKHGKTSYKKKIRN
jgi:hypothetical protein